MVAGGGHPTHQWFGMYYAGQAGRRLPVPIFQALEDFAVYLILIAIERRLDRWPDGTPSRRLPPGDRARHRHGPVGDRALPRRAPVARRGRPPRLGPRPAGGHPARGRRHRRSSCARGRAGSTGSRTHHAPAPATGRRSRTRSSRPETAARPARATPQAGARIRRASARVVALALDGERVAVPEDPARPRARAGSRGWSRPVLRRGVAPWSSRVSHVAPLLFHVPTRPLGTARKSPAPARNGLAAGGGPHADAAPVLQRSCRLHAQPRRLMRWKADGRIAEPAWRGLSSLLRVLPIWRRGRR